MKPHRFARGRMRESEEEGMQPDAVQRVGSAAIGPVSGDGMAAVRQLRPDLILATRLEPDLERSMLRSSPKDAKVQDRLLACLLA